MMNKTRNQIMILSYLIMCSLWDMKWKGISQGAFKKFLQTAWGSHRSTSCSPFNFFFFLGRGKSVKSASNTCREFCLCILTVLSNTSTQDFEKAVFRHLCQQNSVVGKLTQVSVCNNCHYPDNNATRLYSHLCMVRASWCHPAGGENTAWSMLISLTFPSSESNWLYLNEKHMSTPQAPFYFKELFTDEAAPPFLPTYTLFPVNCCDYQTCQPDCIIELPW